MKDDDIYSGLLAMHFARMEGQAEGWEKAIDTAYEHYLTEEQRDHLHALNPYKGTPHEQNLQRLRTRKRH